MRYTVRRAAIAIRQFRDLPPEPKRDVKDALRALADYPYGPDTLRMQADSPTFRLRAGDYRILFQPGPGRREITVFRIALRSVAYEGYERSSRHD